MRREIPSFYIDFSICPKPRVAPAARPRRAPKVNRLPRTLKLNLLTFLKSPKSSAHASGAWRHSHPSVIIPFWDFYFDICEWHIIPAHAWTPALMLHLTNPCAKRKVVSLTKPKGKIYKTKSLGHYITSEKGVQSLIIIMLCIITCNYESECDTYTWEKYTLTQIALYIIIIIIITSWRLHGYSWSPLAIPPYRSSFLVGPQGYIPYPHRAAVCRFELVVLLLLGHMRGPWENIPYELIPASPAVSCMSSSSNFDSFRDGREVAVQGCSNRGEFIWNYSG